MEDGFTSDSIDNYLWVNKYRPKKLEDLKLPDDYMKDFQKFIAYRQIPHLLLYGPPGSGKCVDGDEIIEVFIEIDDEDI